MPTNFFFNNTSQYSEQNLIEELVIEAIKIHGIEVYYLPKTLVKEDNLFFEDVLRKYSDQFLIECYVKDVRGFRGRGDLLSKFGLEIRDELTIAIARRRFQEEIVQNFDNISRPQEGDFIYFPPGKDLFEISFVEHESIFYQLGHLNVWELKLEKVEYTSERLATGINEIDSIGEEESLDVYQWAIRDSSGEIIYDQGGKPLLDSNATVVEVDEPLAQNQVTQLEAAAIIDFSETNPFGEDR